MNANQAVATTSVGVKMVRNLRQPVLMRQTKQLVM
ncbi:Uncharacterised protein [Actinobacillus equuli]|nr:Uncharacterised protein [Actinobacillus equuli]